MRSRPGHRDRAERRKSEAGAAGAVRTTIDRSGQPNGAERQRRSGDDLIRSRGHHERAKARREHHPRQDRAEDTGPWSGRRRAERSGQGTGQHHALEPEVDDRPRAR